MSEPKKPAGDTGDQIRGSEIGDRESESEISPILPVPGLRESESESEIGDRARARAESDSESGSGSESGSDSESESESDSESESAAAASIPGSIPTPESTERTYPPDIWDRTADWLVAHSALPALGALTILVGMMFIGVFRGEVVGDDLTFHMAEARRIADCLRDGDWDFWNPSANGGFASLYYYQSVPQLISAIPAALTGHFVFWFQLSVFLPHVLVPLAAYRGARLLGATPWEAFGAAVAVSMISGESRWGTGADGTFQVGLYTQTWALAAFPLALGYGARWITERKSLPTAIAWGAFVTLCHPFAGISVGLALVAAVGGRIAVRLVKDLHTDTTALVRITLLVLCGAVTIALAILAIDDWKLLYLPPLSLSLAITGRTASRVLAAHAASRFDSDVDVRPPPPTDSDPDERWPILGMLVRVGVLGVAMLLAAMPVWLTVLVDYDGFGGFPHRVNDEVGPGFATLMQWQMNGALLDFKRPPILTWLLPAVLLLGSARFLRWLWLPALAFAALLVAGPHMPKTADDLLPAVRFLGAMQIVLAMAAGAGIVAVGAQLWSAPDDSFARRALRITFVAAIGITAAVLLWKFLFGAPDSLPLSTAEFLTFEFVSPSALRIIFPLLIAAGLAVWLLPIWRGLATVSGVRTALAATAAALVVLVVLSGATVIGGRVRVLADFPKSNRAELLEIVDAVAREPQGRKQVANGAENHWWNQLSYVYARRPALLQMGGGGLQASPNYDFVWSVREFPKLAWVYDTPYLVFAREHADKQPAGDTLFQTPHYELRRLVAPGLVSPIQITGILPADKKDARAAAIAWLRTDAPLANRHLAYAGSGPGGEPPDATVLRTGRTDSPGDHADIFAEVAVARPSTFVIRESWHPRWHAFLDGREVPVRRVTPDFPAVDVPAGRHLLQLRFERPWWAHAAWLAWPAIPLLAWFASQRKRRRQ